MEKFYLLDFLSKNSKLKPETLDVLKYELDARLYYYGSQFRYPFEKVDKKRYLYFRNILKSALIFFKVLKPQNLKPERPSILSNAYFSVNKELQENGYEVFCPSWSLTPGAKVFPDMDVFRIAEKIKSILRESGFNELISEKFEQLIDDFHEKLSSALKERDIKAVIVPNDMGFFERVLIEVCKGMNIPTFIFLHGLPGRYNNIDENRADYLIVWGNRIRENYVKHGFDPNKIIVSGHPYYQYFENKKSEFSLEKILVLTKSMCGGQHSDKVRIADRANLIYYLYSVQKVLMNFEIKSVKLRMHPSENSSWYLQYIDTNFFLLDGLDLVSSIKGSTLVIGPTSTVFLESIYHGVNYLVYEPAIENVDLFKFDLVPPFDGSDSRVPVATNEDELISIIRERQVVDNALFYDYIKMPFDLNFFINIV